jgi:hypothetical protein
LNAVSKKFAAAEASPTHNTSRLPGGWEWLMNRGNTTLNRWWTKSRRSLEATLSNVTEQVTTVIIESRNTVQGGISNLSCAATLAITL